MQRKYFVRPAREEIQEQAVAHRLLDANLQHLCDARAGDTRTQHRFDIRNEEAPFCGYLGDLLTRDSAVCAGVGRVTIVFASPAVLRRSSPPRQRAIDRDSSTSVQLNFRNVAS
jgi:hypothetical protein